MNQISQDDAVISELHREVEECCAQSNFVGGIERMKWYERTYDSPNIRCTAFMWHARCAIESGDLIEAKAAIDSIDRQHLTAQDGIYADLILIQILDNSHQFEAAKTLLLQNLGKPELRQSEDFDVYYQMLGFLVGVLDHLGEYESALAYFHQGESGFGLEFEPRELRDTIILHAAHCLEMIGDYAAAENYLKSLLSNNSGDLTVNIYYHFAILHWKRGWAEEAQSMLQLAKQNLPHGTVTAMQIDEAEAQFRKQVAMRAADETLASQKYPV